MTVRPLSLLGKCGALGNQRRHLINRNYVLRAEIETGFALHALAQGVGNFAQ